MFTTLHFLPLLLRVLSQGLKALLTNRKFHFATPGCLRGWRLLKRGRTSGFHTFATKKAGPRKFSWGCCTG